jgi:hypothetical protein
MRKKQIYFFKNNSGNIVNIRLGKFEIELVSFTCVEILILLKNQRGISQTKLLRVLLYSADHSMCNSV